MLSFDIRSSADYNDFSGLSVTQKLRKFIRKLKELYTMLFVIEIIGTIAFAISGASCAIQKKMDIFGVCMLGMTTAVGGGITRDLILGITPPAAFQHPVYAMIAVGVSILFFLPVVRRWVKAHQKFYDDFLFQTDSLGLGAFTVVGVQAAYTAIPDANMFLATFVAVLTGVGGGVLRDVLSNSMPYIFVKHFYATASLIGSIATVLVWKLWDPSAAMVVGICVVVALRELANRFRWNLPRAE